MNRYGKKDSTGRFLLRKIGLDNKISQQNDEPEEFLELSAPPPNHISEDEIDDKLRDDFKFIHPPLVTAIEKKVIPPEMEEEASKIRNKARNKRICKAVLKFLRLLTTCNYTLDQVRSI